mmetsp:Transcript_8287/g.23013  ORF Transcript_8287/g.23013 Transcript_8287/m.23013 type:complete len:120 (-) Transcript_8287:977-1336(-)
MGTSKQLQQCTADVTVTVVTDEEQNEHKSRPVRNTVNVKLQHNVNQCHSDATINAAVSNQKPFHTHQHRKNIDMWRQRRLKCAQTRAKQQGSEGRDECELQHMSRLPPDDVPSRKTSTI